MKIIQLTDLHFVPPGLRILGLDPQERLRAAIAEINRDHGDADFCVLTGDLADRGDPLAYDLLGETLAELNLPKRLIIGNHDNRENFLAAFPDQETDEDGYLQSALRKPEGLFLFLDTKKESGHDGEYCAKRCRWLADQLDQREVNEPAYLFFHHPPFDVGIPSLDRIAITETDEIAALLTSRANIRQLFFGHLHRSVSGNWRGLSYSCLPSLAHQVPLDFHQEKPVPYNRERPAYAVIFIGDDQVTVHIRALNEEPALPRDLPRYGEVAT